MITNVQGTISSSVINYYDQMLIDDYYVLFKVDDYDYALAHGSKEDFAVSGSTITGSDVEIISYCRTDASSGYSNYYYFETSEDDISVSFDDTIIYSNIIEAAPRLLNTEERSQNHVSLFISGVFLLFFTICVVFNLFGSLRFRVERRTD